MQWHIIPQSVLVITAHASKLEKQDVYLYQTLVLYSCSFLEGNFVCSEE